MGMAMIRLAILVEGDTEEEFVNLALMEHLRLSGVEAQPVSLDGGLITVPRVASEMANLYWSFDSVTSLIDFYGFRNKGDATVEELETRIDDELISRISGDWDKSRVFPYIQRHEFEALLFSDVTVFQYLKDVPAGLVENLRQIRHRFQTPEHIDDSPLTAPSKRIENLIPNYSKRTDGPLIAESIGLDKIRSECPRFNAWVTRLESLNVSSS